MLSFEGKRIDVGANKLKLRRFEIRAFCDKMRSFCTISASTFWKIQPEDGNETLIFKRFRLFRSRFDSSDCQSPSKCFVLSIFDIPAYYLAGFSKRLSTVTSPVSRVPPLPLPNFPVLSSYKNGNCLSIPTSLDILDNIHPRKKPLACVVFDQGRKPELKLACFLRARQKLTGRRLSKSRYGTNVRARFARREKSLPKNFSD